jgi:hypothetical protein
MKRKNKKEPAIPESIFCDMIDDLGIITGKIIGQNCYEWIVVSSHTVELLLLENNNSMVARFEKGATLYIRKSNWNIIL